LTNTNYNIENLIHEYLTETISQNEKDELFSWLASDTNNIKYFNQITDIWLSSSVFQDTTEFNTDEGFNRIKAKINFVNTKIGASKFSVIQLTWQRAAAILILIMLTSSLATKFIFTAKADLPKAESPFIFEVPNGSKATVILPDGSKVVLNAGTKLTCNAGFGKTNRNLNMVGEGYFDVAKNKKLPFLVHAGNLFVKALGTEFNVKAYPNDKNIEAILIRGSIQVNKLASHGIEEKPLVLLPKQCLIYNKKSDKFQINIPVLNETRIAEKPVSIPHDTAVVILKTKIDPVIYTTWKEASWTIYRLDLSDLATDLERKYDVTIHFGSESLKKIKFTGTLPNISLEQVLAAIRLTSPIEYKVQGKQVELTADEKLMPSYKQYYPDTE
jgi:ferric-dicitrate binding protein FerR (iron transport regulator)